MRVAGLDALYDTRRSGPIRAAPIACSLPLQTFATPPDSWY